MYWHELRLIEIVAPAGYGKTTFAALWLHTLSNHPADDRPTAIWLALDPAQNSATQFTHQLGEVLNSQFPALEEFFALARAGQITTHRLAEACCREIGTSARPVLLVIDDFHVAQDEEIHAFIQHLVDDAPDTLHLMLLSRTPPPLRIHRLARAHAVVVLEEADLRLDHEEFERFAAAVGLQADPNHEIERRSAGWILGLHMLAMSSRTRTSAQTPAPGNARMLADFFDTEILAPLPPPLRTLLVETSVLPFLSTPLVAAAAALDPAHCDEMLCSAAASNVFINVFGEDHASYRLHPLFREHLLRLPGAGPDPLRRRAAAWLAAHGEIDAALDLLPPSCEDDAVEIITRAAHHALLHHELSSVRRWLARLPEARVAASPRLSLDAAWHSLFSDSRDLRPHVERARAALAVNAVIEPDEYCGEVEVLDAWCLYLEGRNDAALNAVRAAERNISAKPTITAAYVAMLQALSSQGEDDFLARSALLHRSAALFHQAGYTHGAVIATMMLNSLKLRYCDLPGALASCDYALGILAHAHQSHSPIACEIHLARAELLYFMGRIAEARIDFQRAIQLADIGAYLVHVYLQLCDLHEHRTEAIDDVEDVRLWTPAAASLNPISISMFGYVRILRDQHLGRPDRCWQTVESIGILPTDLQPHHPDAVWMAVLAGAVLGNRPIPNLDDLLHAFIHRTHETQYLWMHARTRALLIVHYERTGRHELALAALRDLKPDVERWQAPRLLQDFAEIRTLLALPKHQPSLDSEPQHPFNLSIQELRVLRLLTAGRSTDDMAAELVVSRETLRTHLRRCFRKLGVHSRLEAVKAAREAGII